MTEPQITYSDRLRKARIERGLRQVELAQLLDISSSTVSVIENGHQAPSFPLVVRWAGACEVSLDWVATGITAELVAGGAPLELGTQLGRVEYATDARPLAVVRS